SVTISAAADARPANRCRELHLPRKGNPASSTVRGDDLVEGRSVSDRAQSRCRWPATASHVTRPEPAAPLRPTHHPWASAGAPPDAPVTAKNPSPGERAWRGRSSSTDPPAACDPHADFAHGATVV